MVVIASDLNLYEPSLVAVTDADPVGGAISGSLARVDGIVDEIFFTSSSKALGGGNNTRYSKVFARNDNSADTLSDVRVYLGNVEHFGQIAFALEQSAGIAILDGDQIIASPQTAPVVSSFSQVATYAAGITVGADGLLGPLKAQGVWIRQIITEGINADGSAFVDVVFGNN